MFGAPSFLEDVWIKALHRFISNALISLHPTSLLRGEFNTRHSNLKSNPHGGWQTGHTVLGLVSSGDHLRKALDKHGYEINLERREFYMIIAQVMLW